MQNWATYQRAALEYSILRPRTISTSIVPAIDTRVQNLPDGCIGVRFVAWGERVSAVDAFTSEATDQGWCYEDGTLVLTPPPETADPIAVVYEARHLPDEETQTYPTIPAAHEHHLDDLEQAITLEIEADGVARGPTMYALGQTQVSREAGIQYLQTRARALRDRVQQALEDPMALWR